MDTYSTAAVTPPSRSATDRLPSLDGLRAISIGLVIIFHLGLVGQLDIVGNLGVRVFFVISGYLITRLLLIEEESSGTISLSNFYVRRVFRIFPAFYVFWGTVATCSLLSVITVPRSDLIQAATYTINYTPGQTHALYLRHTWSLAVEEQFYLLWPVVVLLAGKRRALTAAAIFLLVSPVVRLVYWFFVPALHSVIDSRFETVADALATGCLLAGIQSALAARKRYNAALRFRWFFLLPIFIVAFAIVVAPRPRTYYGAGITILNLAIAICIDRFVRYPAGEIGSVLNAPLMRTVGVLSYSIYVWQQPFLVAQGSALYQKFPFNLICVAVFSTGSWLLVERPMLDLRKRFSRARHARGVVAAS